MGRQPDGQCGAEPGSRSSGKAARELAPDGRLGRQPGRQRVIGERGRAWAWLLAGEAVPATAGCRGTPRGTCLSIRAPDAVSRLWTQLSLVGPGQCGSARLAEAPARSNSRASPASANSQTPRPQSGGRSMPLPAVPGSQRRHKPPVRARRWLAWPNRQQVERRGHSPRAPRPSAAASPGWSGPQVEHLAARPLQPQGGRRGCAARCLRHPHPLDGGHRPGPDHQRASPSRMVSSGDAAAAAAGGRHRACQGRGAPMPDTTACDRSPEIPPGLRLQPAPRHRGARGGDGSGAGRRACIDFGTLAAPARQTAGPTAVIGRRYAASVRLVCAGRPGSRSRPCRWTTALRPWPPPAYVATATRWGVRAVVVRRRLRALVGAGAQRTGGLRHHRLRRHRR